MKLNPAAFLCVAAALMVATLSVQATVVNLSTSFEQPVATEGGGRTLLVEEITATHCVSCAEIDPELLQVADSHGSRIALVALHPSDGFDAFQPAAAQHRIERLNLSNPNVAQSTPTFVVEAGEPRRGYDAWTDVQRDILNAELARQDASELDVEVVKTDNGYRASVNHADLVSNNETQLTLMVIEHGKSMPENAVNPGGDHRDRVVVGLAECALDNNTITASVGLLSATVESTCETSFSIEFENLSSWSVLLVHEATAAALANGEDPSSHGAVELAFRDRAATDEEVGNVGTLLLVVCGVLAMASIVRKK